jgi:cell pole-organizing protein PopZ
MADSPDQEPSIEEILASIRQIISDDDEPAAPAPAPEPEEEDDDVLELTEVVEEKRPAKEPDYPPPPRKVELDLQEAEPEPDTSDILTDHAANAALAGFMRLSRDTPVTRTGNDGLTLEDIVRDLMRPMLRDWLDRNLPSLIEKVVEKELDKLARKAIDD